jgi:hypothetical protein
MKVEIFTLCDQASNQGDKLNIIGAFDSVSVKTVPAKHPHLFIVARVRFERSEQGTHKVTAMVIDEDGKIIGNFIGDDIPIGLPPNSDALRANFLVRINGFVLPKFGEFRVDLVIDGLQAAQIPLYVDQA